MGFMHNTLRTRLVSSHAWLYMYVMYDSKSQLLGVVSMTKKTLCKFQVDAALESEK